MGGDWGFKKKKITKKRVYIYETQIFDKIDLIFFSIQNIITWNVY